MSEKFVSASIALLVAFGGVALAFLVDSRHYWLAGALVVAPLAIGLAGDLAARRLLPKNPVAAVKIMELWVLVPGTLGAIGAGLVIFVAIRLEASDALKGAPKHLLAAIAGAVSTFLTNLVIKSADDADSGWTGAHVKARFLSSYLRHEAGRPHQPGCYYFKKGSVAELWVQSDGYHGVSGWGWTARRTRAQKIAERLGTPDRVP
jgi:uncharacterized membrane protein YjjB (DUF3815 family)